MVRPPPQQVTRWWWLRHAVVPNPDRQIYGQLDWPADTGDAALFAAQAAHLPDPAVWITSTLQRTRQTATALQEALGKEFPVQAVPELVEQSFGAWQGRPSAEVYAEITERDPFWLAPAHSRPPEGESFVELMRRVADAIDSLTRAHAGQDIVAITHGGTIRAAIALALGLAPELALRFAIDNVSLTRLEHIVLANGTIAWRVQSINQLPAKSRNFGI